MPSALVGRASCARCAEVPPRGAVRCPRCGVPLEEASVGSALVLGGPLLGVVAAGGRRSVAVAVDLAGAGVLAVGAGIAVDLAAAALQRDLELAVLAGIVAAVALLAGLAAALGRSGRTPGRALLALRTVDTVTGLPTRSAAAALLAATTGRGVTVVTADLRLGRDPMTSRLAAPEIRDGLVQAPVPSAPRAPDRPEPVDAAGARLVFDSGDELVVDGPVLIGRAPEPRPPIRTVHALPDLTRGLGRTHLLADWSNGLVWVTDLGSPGGSVVEPEPGVAQPLVPQVRTALAPGWRVRIGGRGFTVRSLGTREVRRG